MVSEPSVAVGSAGVAPAVGILPSVMNANASLSDAEVAVAAARAGAAVVRDMHGRRLARIDKGAGDFATTADVEAEKAILNVIRAARPHDAVLGEEGGQQGAHGAARQWLVDPLCGTMNYAVGNMLVAVNVALRDGAAAVADPFSGEIFFTDGKTACVRRDGTDTALAPSSVSGLVDFNLDPPFPSAPGFRAVDLQPTRRSPSGSGREWYPRLWRWPGSPPASAPRTSPMAATFLPACTSRPVSPCAGLRAAWSPGLTALQSGLRAAG